MRYTWFWVSSYIAVKSPTTETHTLSRPTAKTAQRYHRRERRDARKASVRSTNAERDTSCLQTAPLAFNEATPDSFSPMKRKIKLPYSKRWKDLRRRNAIITYPSLYPRHITRRSVSIELYPLPASIRSDNNTAPNQTSLENAIPSKDNHQQRIIWLYNGPILSFNTDFNPIPRTFDTRRRLPLRSARQSLFDISDRYSESIIDGESHFVSYVYGVWEYFTLYLGLIKD